LPPTPLSLSFTITIFHKLGSTDSVTIKDLYFNSHAIVIGISNYKDPNLKLTNPVNDAKAMAKILKEKYGFNNVKLLLDKDATKEKLEEIFEDYIRGDIVTQKDRLLVYYSGHGDIRSSSNQQGRQIEESFLIPHDAKPGTYASYLKMNTITDNCGLCNAKHILLILDSCFSGTAFLNARAVVEKPKKITDEYLKGIISKRAIQAVAATDKNQPADDKSTLNPDHGAFTGVLLKILNDEPVPDNDGILTASEVGSYLEKNVPRSGIPQNPISGHLPGSEVGEFIFNVFNVSKSQSTLDNSVLKKPIDFSSFITIRDQGPDVAGMLYSVVYAMEVSLAQRGDMTRLSARYIYEKLKTKDENPNPNSGVTTWSASFVIQQFGTVPESDWPYQSENRKLPEGMDWPSLNSIAEKYTARTFYLTSFEDIFFHLNNGRAVVMSHTVYPNFVDTKICDAKLYREKKFVISLTKEILAGYQVGRTMSTIIGFDPPTSLFKCAHTYGTGWGNEGFFYYEEKDARKVIILESSFAVEMNKLDNEN